jgi:hypothetical protein
MFRWGIFERENVSQWLHSMEAEGRPISPAEVDVIRAALSRTGVAPFSSKATESVKDLFVFGGCKCGCQSVDFERDPKDKGRILADGIGRTSKDTEVGIVVWGTLERVKGLEIYELGAPALGLPVPDSIKSWDGTKRSDA